jgi:ABC-type nickel/cobalt efflux system permease component RcnA
MPLKEQPMTASHSHHPTPARRQLLRTVIIALAALLIMLAAGGLIGSLLGTGDGGQAMPKSPFGVGMKEGGGGMDRLSDAILSVQSAFSKAMTGAISLLSTDPAAIWTLLALSFGYGVFHAAGPGHGKAVIAAYGMARDQAVTRAVLMALAAALLQAIVAIALVGVLSILLNATAARMGEVATLIEALSFAAIGVVGLVLLWQKSGSLAALGSASGHHHTHDHHHGHDHHHHEGEACTHHHAPVAVEGSGLKGAVAAVLAAGIRPCSGAIIVLVFALSQNVLAIGVLAALVMALGTALTTGGLAALAILAKRTATRLAGRIDSQGALTTARVLEVLAAAFLAMIGISLLIGTLVHDGKGLG